MIVRIKEGYYAGVKVPNTWVEVTPKGNVLWKGEGIGKVWKGTRTYSPPMYPGSRVVKYHKQVTEWKGSTKESDRTNLWADTRREVVGTLIALAIEQEQKRHGA